MALRQAQTLTPLLVSEPWGLRGREATRRRRRRYPTIATLTITTLIVLPFVAYVAAVSNAARIGYRILQENQEIAALETDHERLQAIASSLRAPERIEYLAVTRLGLQPPNVGQIASLSVPAPSLRRDAQRAPGLWQRVGEYFHRNEAVAAPRSP
ncbi:MAG TPA: hypothetical protein VEP50_16100 [bacterium]|nr:hypothetical protein [bacterium]